jgi:hypothetical protein
MQVPLIAFEAGLGVVVVGWCVWELMSLRRERERDRLKAQPKLPDAAMKSSPTDDV